MRYTESRFNELIQQRQSKLRGCEKYICYDHKISKCQKKRSKKSITIQYANITKATSLSYAEHSINTSK